MHNCLKCGKEWTCKTLHALLGVEEFIFPGFERYWDKKCFYCWEYGQYEGGPMNSCPVDWAQAQNKYIANFKAHWETVRGTMFRQFIRDSGIQNLPDGRRFCGCNKCE